MCVYIDSPSATSGLRYFSTRDFKFKVKISGNFTIESGEISLFTDSRKGICFSKTNHIGGVM